MIDQLKIILRRKYPHYTAEQIEFEVGRRMHDVAAEEHKECVCDDQRSEVDITYIKGIGKKLKATLAEVGIHTIRDIAELTPERIEELNTRLTFKGRIDYENWVEQARDIIGR